MKKNEKYGAVVSFSEIESKSHTVMTFNNDIWVNLHDGRFILRNSLHTPANKIVSGLSLFDSIRTMTIDNQLVAKRTKPRDKLRYLFYSKRIKNH